MFRRFMRIKPLSLMFALYLSFAPIVWPGGGQPKQPICNPISQNNQNRNAEPVTTLIQNMEEINFHYNSWWFGIRRNENSCTLANKILQQNPTLKTELITIGIYPKINCENAFKTLNELVRKINSVGYDSGKEKSNFEKALKILNCIIKKIYRNKTQTLEEVCKTQFDKDEAKEFRDAAHLWNLKGVWSNMFDGKISDNAFSTFLKMALGDEYYKEHVANLVYGDNNNLGNKCADKLPPCFLPLVLTTGSERNHIVLLTVTGSKGNEKYTYYDPQGRSRLCSETRKLRDTGTAINESEPFKNICKQPARKSKITNKSGEQSFVDVIDCGAYVSREILLTSNPEVRENRPQFPLDGDITQFRAEASRQLSSHAASSLSLMHGPPPALPPAKATEKIDEEEDGSILIN
ncbi:MAG: hypothetical protein HQK53_18790 [Oligoflexia bacterium]|nr:hypothetical protein [Oligoflexia bacterium]